MELGRPVAHVADFRQLIILVILALSQGRRLIHVSERPYDAPLLITRRLIVHINERVDFSLIATAHMLPESLRA